MSGHSKWSQIKRQKGVADIKRGTIFSRLGNAITLAAKRGGGNPTANFTLRMAIEKARTANMPKENIERAVKRGAGELGGAQIEEVIYEGIGPSGIGIIIEVATDNKNHASATIKNTLSQYGGKLASSGAVTYQFQRMGKLVIDPAGKSAEEIELNIIDAGAQDFEEEGELVVCYTRPAELEKVKKMLEGQGTAIREATLTWEPNNFVNITNKVLAEKILKLMSSLEDLEEVVAVYSNFDLPKEFLS